MKSLKSKLALSVVGIALLATPAFAQAPRHVQAQQYQDSAVTYPGLAGSDSEAYTPQYVPGYGNIGASSGEW
jgi:hypothetical protein